MKKEPTINVGFVMTHGPENKHLKKEWVSTLASFVNAPSRMKVCTMEITEDLIVDLA